MSRFSGEHSILRLTRRADIWRDTLIFYLKINAWLHESERETRSPCFSQWWWEMECTVSSGSCSICKSNLLRTLEDIRRQAREKVAVYWGNGRGNAVKRISRNLRKNVRQKSGLIAAAFLLKTNEWQISSFVQTQHNVFPWQLPAGWAPDLAERCMHLVCVCGWCVKIYLSVLMAHKPTRQSPLTLTNIRSSLFPRCDNGSVLLMRHFYLTWPLNMTSAGLTWSVIRLIYRFGDSKHHPR